MRVPTTQVAYRLPDHLLERLDRHVKRMTKGAPKGATITRTDAVIQLLERALTEAEAREQGGAS